MNGNNMTRIILSSIIFLFVLAMLPFIIDDRALALTEADCRACHEDPAVVPDPNIPGVHHVLVGNPVPPDTIRPFPSGDVNGNYDCFSCHQLVSDRGVIEIKVYRDCLFCHTGASHEAVHDQTFLPSPDCSQCHVANVVTEHVANRNLGCDVCHSSPDPNVQNAIMDGMNGLPVLCNDCHGPDAGMHEAAHDQTFLPSPDCAQCHVDNVVTEHVTNRNLSCEVCHSSPDPNVQNAIMDGMNGLPVLCNDCHGPDAGMHEAAHDQTSVNSPECLECHVDNVVTEHVTNQSLSCSVCHDSARPEVQDAITRGIGGEVVYCSDCHGFVSHAEQHESTNTDCTACHPNNLQDAHNNDCAICHDSINPVVQDAINIGNTDCYACHVDQPHAQSCQVCHADKQFPDYIGQGRRIHDRHMDNVICGICHAIPETVDIGTPNNACGNLCHSSESYSRYQDIHEEHMGEFGNVPNPCYWCHGLSVPQRPADICTMCHTDKSGGAERAHDIHAERFDCTVCHESVAGFGPDVRFDPSRQVCTFCHSPESDGARTVHRKHVFDKAQCYVCHGDSDVYASFRGDRDCTICHDPKSGDFDRIHKKHAGNAMMCTVCHSIIPPNVDGIMTNP